MSTPRMPALFVGHGSPMNALVPTDGIELGSISMLAVLIGNRR